MKITLRGFLRYGTYGEGDDILYISSEEEPLAELLSELQGKLVTVKFWIADKEATLDELKRSFFSLVCGEINACLECRYSDLTGYLYTTEDLEIGGHDLINTLSSSLGKFLHLEIHINENQLSQ